MQAVGSFFPVVLLRNNEAILPLQESLQERSFAPLDLPCLDLVSAPKAKGSRITFLARATLLSQGVWNRTATGETTATEATTTRATKQKESSTEFTESCLTVKAGGKIAQPPQESPST